MKISYSNMQEDIKKCFEEETARHAGKLEKLLKHYDADALLLHATIGKQPRTTDFQASLNLTMPTGALRAVAAGSDARAAAKGAFAELEQLVKKHQEKLRKDYLWKRKRGSSGPRLSNVPPAK